MENQPRCLRDLPDVGLPCAKCMVKHLNASAAYVSTGLSCAIPGDRHLARALSSAVVAYGEMVVGYTHHRGYVDGLLVMGEDRAVSVGMPDVARQIREARVLFEESGRLDAGLLPPGMALPWYGHLAEALREAPDEFAPKVFSVVGLVDDGEMCPRDYVRSLVELSEEVESSVFRPSPPSSSAGT